MAVLGNLIEQVRGVSYKPEDLHTTLNEDSIILLRANNIKDGKLNFDDVVYVDKKKVSEKQILKAGDILICASSGSKELVGKAAYVESDLQMTFGAFCKVARPKTACPKYIGHFFNSPYYREQIANSAAGANINNIRNEHIDVLEIVWPSMEEQHSAVAILDKVTELIAMRKEQLAKLDELVKSRFIELFGDQKTNPHNLKVGKLSDVADIYLGLTHTPTYVEQGKPFLSVRDISSGEIDFSNCHYITEEEFDSLPKGARPQAGDMLFCRVGTIGKPVIIPENTPEFGTFVSVGYLRKKTNVNNCYLKAWMENEYFMRQVYDNVAGASQINLNTGWLKNFRILIPPIDLQNQFTSFVEQTDKSKSAIQQSLDKLELLKKSLMQKYFG